eukprot:5766363-Karenia_brevis.AAC.1
MRSGTEKEGGKGRKEGPKSQEILEESASISKVPYVSRMRLARGVIRNTMQSEQSSIFVPDTPSSDCNPLQSRAAKPVLLR